VLTITLTSLAKGAKLHAKVTFTRRKAMYLSTKHLRLRVRTPPPRRLALHLRRDGAKSATVAVKVRRLR